MFVLSLLGAPEKAMSEEVLVGGLDPSGNKFLVQAIKKSFWTIARYSMIMLSAHILTGSRNKNTLRLGTKKQDFLEARGENVDLPLNTHTDDLPLMGKLYHIQTFFERCSLECLYLAHRGYAMLLIEILARVVSNKRIAGSSVGDEVRHIVIRHYGKMRFWEGQVRINSVDYFYYFVALMLCALLIHVIFIFCAA